jgi:hypothetical protein
MSSGKWNRYHEKLIQHWSRQCKTYSIMHTLTAQYYSVLDRRLGMPVVILGALTASTIFSTSQGQDVYSYMKYINGCMVLLMTTLTGITRFLGTHEKQQKHTSAAFKYTAIAMNVDTTLSFPRNERKEIPIEMLNSVKSNILEIREHAPDLPTWVLSDCIKTLDKSIVNTKTRVNEYGSTKNMLKHEKKQHMWPGKQTPSSVEQDSAISTPYSSKDYSEKNNLSRHTSAEPTFWSSESGSKEKLNTSSRKKNRRSRRQRNRYNPSPRDRQEHTYKPPTPTDITLPKQMSFRTSPSYSEHANEQKHELQNEQKHELQNERIIERLVEDNVVIAIGDSKEIINDGAETKDIVSACDTDDNQTVSGNIGVASLVMNMQFDPTAENLSNILESPTTDDEMDIR